MKVTIKDMIAANAALNGMVLTGGAPYRIVRGLQKLRKVFDEEIRGADAESGKKIQELGGRPQKDGTIEFPDVEKRIEFEKSWDDIMNTAIDVDMDRINLSLYTDNIIFQNLNADVDALSAFIDFGDD